MGNSTYKHLADELGLGSAELEMLSVELEDHFQDYEVWSKALAERLIASKRLTTDEWFKQGRLGVDTAQIGVPALHSLHLLLEKKVDEKLGARAKRARPDAKDMAADRTRTDAADEERLLIKLRTKGALLEGVAGQRRCHAVKEDQGTIAPKKQAAKEDQELMAFEKQAAKDEQETNALNNEAAKAKLGIVRFRYEPSVAGGSGSASPTVASPALSANSAPSAPASPPAPPVGRRRLVAAWCAVFLPRVVPRPRPVAPPVVVPRLPTNRTPRRPSASCVCFGLLYPHQPDPQHIRPTTPGLFDQRRNDPPCWKRATTTTQADPRPALWLQKNPQVLKPVIVTEHLADGTAAGAMAKIDCSTTMKAPAITEHTGE
ncbi:hypothetical protein FN846DRAFT_889671 [Sphaerosporella brunnea]|uniref:Uncharacterized protein n=1 Tax=Sphaerosporella brunnea TaxID=1250544 RepID=A0A5J5EZY5_9PEZI|nr:hypothetical protein FN846DRAFT_889671 [Sphaerosporella brunnea]